MWVFNAKSGWIAVRSFPWGRPGAFPPHQPNTSTLAHVPISELAVVNLPTLDFSPSVRPKQSQGLFPALLFPAPRSSTQELKSSSAAEVTMLWKESWNDPRWAFKRTGTSHPSDFWVQHHPRLMALIKAVEFKTRARWDYFGSNWTWEDLGLFLLCWCLSGSLLNGGCNSWSNWTHQHSFGTKTISDASKLDPSATWKHGFHLTNQRRPFNAGWRRQ